MASDDRRTGNGTLDERERERERARVNDTEHSTSRESANARRTNPYWILCNSSSACLSLLTNQPTNWRNGIGQDSDSSDTRDLQCSTNSRTPMHSDTHAIAPTLITVSVTVRSSIRWIVVRSRICHCQWQCDACEGDESNALNPSTM